MGKKDRKKKRSRSSGGKLSGLRLGFKGLVGTGGGQKKKQTLASKIFTVILVIAAIAAVARFVYIRFIR